MAAGSTGAPTGGAALKTRRRKMAKVKRRREPEERTAVRRRGSANENLKRALAECRHGLQEALEQQTATAEVLRVISSSSGELQPVFKAMLANATKLCQASYGAMWLREGDAFRGAAFHGDLPAAYIEQFGALFKPSAEEALARVARTRKPVHVADVRKYRAYLDRSPLAVAGVEVAGIRTLVVVPMLRQNELVGAIAVYRRETRRFSDQQIALLAHFAGQAVIAIENTRLLNELRESLDQQTATADVLETISRSPGELAPMFEAMLAHAMRICEAKFGHLLLYDGEGFHGAYLHNVPAAYRALWEHGPLKPGPKTGLHRLVETKQVFQIADLAADSAYAERDPLRVATVEIAGARTFLGVPMLKESEFVGAIVVYRQEVRAFTDKQIELLSNFAAQAVMPSRIRGCSASCANHWRSRRRPPMCSR
jgi:GAF domain-containing protein